MVFQRPEFGYDSMGQWRRRAVNVPAAPRPLTDVRGELVGRKGYIRDIANIAHLKDHQILNKIMRDPVVRKAVELRQHMTASTSTYLEADDVDSRVLIPYYDKLIKQAEAEFLKGRLTLTMGIIEGMAALKISGQTKEMRIAEDGQFRKWWFPRLYTPINRHAISIVERFRVEERGGERIEIPEHRYATLDRDQWWEVDPAIQDLHYCWLNYHSDAYTVGYGRGLIEALALNWIAKGRVIKSLMQGLDRFGWPMIVASISASSSFASPAGGGNAFSNGDARGQVMADTIAAMRQDANVIVVDSSDKIETIDVSGQSIGALLNLLEYFDKTMVELVLASSMPTGGGQQGSFARAAVEAGSMSSLIKTDRLLLEGSIQNVINACHQFNRTNWQQITAPFLDGSEKPLWFAEPPRIRLGREEDDDVERALKRVQLAREGQLRVRKKDLHAISQFPMPDDDDEDVIDFGAIAMGLPGDPRERALFEQQQAEQQAMQAEEDAITAEQAQAAEMQSPLPFSESMGKAQELSETFPFRDRMSTYEGLTSYLNEYKREMVA